MIINVKPKLISVSETETVCGEMYYTYERGPFSFSTNLNVCTLSMFCELGVNCKSQHISDDKNALGLFWKIWYLITSSKMCIKWFKFEITDYG